MTLALVDIKQTASSQPAAFHELSAAKYLGMSRESFRKKLLCTGIIPFTFHANGEMRIFLKEDLDAYLQSLPKSRMAERENSPLKALKGAHEK